MKEEKDFDLWNKEKNKLEQVDQEFLFHEREIWWCALGLNIGSEQDGKNEFFDRPVLILKKYHKRLLLILPLTSTIKNDIYHYKINNLEKQSCVILSQIRTISSKRLSRKIGTISIKDFLSILFKLIKTLFPI